MIKSRAEKNKRALFGNNYFFLVKAVAAAKCRPKIKAFSALLFQCNIKAGPCNF